jgi:predicted nucleic acid-binding protein
MKGLFVDTAGWMACADGADPDHARGCASRDSALEAGQGLVTSDFVVDETLTLMRLRLGLDAAEAWWRQVDASARLRWERIDAGRFEQARQLFFRYRDKDFSFTDCTSFVLMRELRLTRALTTDRHFRQMGFQVLPAPRTHARKSRPRVRRGPRRHPDPRAARSSPAR